MPEPKNVKYTKERTALRIKLNGFFIDLDPLVRHQLKAILTRDEHRKVKTILEKVKALSNELK